MTDVSVYVYVFLKSYSNFLSQSCDLIDPNLHRPTLTSAAVPLSALPNGVVGGRRLKRYTWSSTFPRAWLRDKSLVRSGPLRWRLQPSARNILTASWVAKFEWKNRHGLWRTVGSSGYYWRRRIRQPRITAGLPLWPTVHAHWTHSLKIRLSASLPFSAFNMIRPAWTSAVRRSPVITPEEDLNSEHEKILRRQYYCFQSFVNIFIFLHKSSYLILNKSCGLKKVTLLGVQFTC